MANADCNVDDAKLANKDCCAIVWHCFDEFRRDTSISKPAAIALLKQHIASDEHFGVETLQIALSELDQSQEVDA